MHVIVYSGNYWNFKMISGENLRRLINENVSFLPVLSDVIFNFIEVNVWSPTVDIDNC